MLLYIHGYGSSGQANKAQILKKYFQVLSPDLDNSSPLNSIKNLDGIVKINTIDLIVGSSLGGFYGSYLSGKYVIPAILINPVVTASQMVKIDTGPVFMKEISEIENSFPKPDDDQLITLFLSLNDDLLDYRVAEKKYPKSERFYSLNGGHEFSSFEEFLPIIRKILK